MTPLQLAQQNSDLVGGLGELARAFLRAHAALQEINRYNRMHNDLEAYLFEIAKWGMGETEEHPKPESFGLLEIDL